MLFLFFFSSPKGLSALYHQIKDETKLVPAVATDIQMIHYNNLAFYDDDFRSVVRNLEPGSLEQLASTEAETGLLPRQSSLKTNPAEG